jgi:hypothetical protein
MNIAMETIMTVKIRNADMNVIRTSRNLRGILDHARRVPVRQVSVADHIDGGALISVYYDNGDSCTTEFASRSVCEGWVKARRSWGLVARDVTGGVTRYM